MAWVARETFEDYSDGETLDTKTGGSGWSDAWAETQSSGTASFDVDDAQAAKGSLSVVLNAGDGDESYVERNLTTAVTSGIVYFDMRADNNNTTTSYFRLHESGTTRIYIRLRGSTGNIEAYNNSSYQTIQAFSANTWYRIGCEIDASGNRFRVNVDGGAFSSYYTVAGGSMTNVSRIRLVGGDAGNMWWDDISEVEGGTPTDYPLTPELGVFTLTGVAATLLFGKTLVMATGIFVLTGVAATLTSAKNLAMATGVFVLTGIATTFKEGINLVASVGTFILTGINVGFKSNKSCYSWTRRTKPTTTYTERTKPSTSWTGRTKP